MKVKPEAFNKPDRERELDKKLGKLFYFVCAIVGAANVIFIALTVAKTKGLM